MTKQFKALNAEDYEWKNGTIDLWCHDVSDGYYTFDELYQHRHALFCALVKLYDNYKTPLGSNVVCYKSKLHSDGTMFEDSFIVMMCVNKIDTTVDQISYHYPLNWWDKFTCMELEKMIPWDGSTPNDVLERLMNL